MSLRVHTYASEAEAAAAVEAIDAARPATEQARTIIGPRGLRRLADQGLVAIDRRARKTAVTDKGREAGLVLDESGCRREHTIPARTWAHPIPLKDGTYAVPVCAEVAGRETDRRGQPIARIPTDTTARTITAADRKPDAEGDAKPVDVPAKSGGR